MRIIAIVLALAACKQEQVNVSVNCESTADPAVICDVKQTLGQSEVEACWDFTIKCADGAIVKAPRSCTKIKDGGSTKVRIAGDKLTGVDKCEGDKPPTASITNMTIDGHASEMN